jgi:hypothetical protein
MAPYQESDLLKTADKPTVQAINIWHSQSSQMLGNLLEVVVDNRRNHPNFASFDGEFNTAFPAGYKGQVVLSVWLDSFPNYKPLILTHEVGHWVLKFQGFRAFIRQPRDAALEGLFNDVASHSLLYALQKSIGQDPQAEIDSRCAHNIRLSSQPKKGDPIICGLMMADDWMNCSGYKMRQKLKWTLQKYQPQTWRMLESILNVASQYDLSKPETNIRFRKELLKVLKITGAWTEKDDIEQTKKLILEVEGSKS